jgi:putative endonuclease
LAVRGGWVYIMTNRPNGTLYVGVTADFGRRAYEHRQGLVEGFTRRYGLKRLVWKEFHEDIRNAIQRESNIKLAARLEGEAHSRTQPRIAGSFRRAELVRA